MDLIVKTAKTTLYAGTHVKCVSFLRPGLICLLVRFMPGFRQGRWIVRFAWILACCTKVCKNLWQNSPGLLSLRLFRRAFFNRY